METGGIFAENLRLYRAASGMSCRQLADFSNSSVSSIRKYESGSMPLPRIKTLATLANALDISANDLLNGLFGRTEVDDLAELRTYLTMEPSRSLRKAQIISKNLLSYLEPHAIELPDAGFGKRIKILREDMGLGLEHLAEAGHVTVGHLKQVESSQKYLNTEMFLDFCNIMGASPNYFMRNMLRSDAVLETGIPLLDRISALNPRQIKVIAEAVRETIKE